MPKRLSMFMGQIIKRSDNWEAVRVRVYKMKMDNYLNMYFNKRYHLWAADPKDETKEGDIVLIKELKESYNKSYRVSHFVKEIVFPVGNITDPVTGRRCRGQEFIDESTRTFPTLNAYTKTDNDAKTYKSTKSK